MNRWTLEDCDRSLRCRPGADGWARHDRARQRHRWLVVAAVVVWWAVAAYAWKLIFE